MQRKRNTIFPIHSGLTLQIWDWRYRGLAVLVFWGQKSCSWIDRWNHTVACPYIIIPKYVCVCVCVFDNGSLILKRASRLKISGRFTLELGRGGTMGWVKPFGDFEVPLTWWPRSTFCEALFILGSIGCSGCCGGCFVVFQYKELLKIFYIVKVVFSSDKCLTSDTYTSGTHTNTNYLGTESITMTVSVRSSLWIWPGSIWRRYPTINSKKK